jgi:hypothetical protein
MKKNGVPYGEARRLAYFVVICKNLLSSGPVNVDFLIDRLLLYAKKLNPKLKEHVRKTGIMQSRAVARNYLSFCNRLRFLELEGRLAVPNGYTVFVGNLGECENFSLTPKEKIGLFLRLVDFNEFVKLLSSLKEKNWVKDHVKPDLSEHFVETFFEWFVDLGIVKPSSQRFGVFFLTSLGDHVKEACKQYKDKFEISRIFASYVLDAPIKRDLDISDIDFWKQFTPSFKRLSQYTRSEIDPNLYSALPAILDLQVNLILNFKQLSSIERLIEKLKNISMGYDAIFSWDPLVGAGYIKLHG